jgi:hypothetical protein
MVYSLLPTITTWMVKVLDIQDKEVDLTIVRVTRVIESYMTMHMIKHVTPPYDDIILILIDGML